MWCWWTGGTARVVTGTTRTRSCACTSRQRSTVSTRGSWAATRSTAPGRTQVSTSGRRRRRSAITTSGRDTLRIEAGAGRTVTVRRLPAPELARARRVTRERAGLEPEPPPAGEEDTAPRRDAAAVLADVLRRDGTVFSANGNPPQRTRPRRPPRGAGIDLVRPGPPVTNGPLRDVPAGHASAPRRRHNLGPTLATLSGYAGCAPTWSAHADTASAPSRPSTPPCRIPDAEPGARPAAAARPARASRCRARGRSMPDRHITPQLSRLGRLGGSRWVRHCRS
jgi:hypothetical protein